MSGPDDPLPLDSERRRAAQKLADEAWSIAESSQTDASPVELCRQAIEIHRDCTSAIHLLAEIGFDDRDQRLQMLELACSAGRRELGAGFFARNAGRFWELPETQPYMRACFAHANAMRTDRRRAVRVAAVDVYAHLLELRHRDELGCRASLVSLLLSFGRVAEARKVLDRYPGDRLLSSRWLGVLATYASGGHDEAGRIARDAEAHNRLVLPFAIGIDRPQRGATRGVVREPHSPSEAAEVFELLRPVLHPPQGNRDARAEAAFAGLDGWLIEQFVEACKGEETLRAGFVILRLPPGRKIPEPVMARFLRGTRRTKSRRRAKLTLDEDAAPADATASAPKLATASARKVPAGASATDSVRSAAKAATKDPAKSPDRKSAIESAGESVRESTMDSAGAPAGDSTSAARSTASKHPSRDASHDPSTPASIPISAASRRARTDRRDDRRAEAQQLAYDAMELLGSGRRADALALCRQATEIDPGCVDALLMIADHEIDDPEEFRKALDDICAVGARELGTAFIRRNAGSFWSLVETRPYMRALAAYAETLRTDPRRDFRERAPVVFAEMLRLNPNDNQGAREPYASLLLELGRSAAAQELLDAYEEDDSLTMEWLRAIALLALGREREAQVRASRAAIRNVHVLPYATGARRMPRTRPGEHAVGVDSPSEALHAAALLLPIVRATKGLKAWLREIDPSSRASGSTHESSPASDAGSREGPGTSRKPRR